MMLLKTGSLLLMPQLNEFILHGSLLHELSQEKVRRRICYRLYEKLLFFMSTY